MHSEGLAELIGDLTLSCTGGTSGASASFQVFAILNTAITNRLDANGNPIGIVITGATGANPQLSSSTTLNTGTLTYTVPTPSTTPVTINISGIRAAIATFAPSTSPVTVTYNVLAVGAVISVAPLTAAVAAPTLLSSSINNGIPCTGSPLPATLDFPSFAAQSSSSTVRVTEASATAFTPANPGDDSGLRILVRLSGYGSASRVFVPDVIAGNNATVPTSGGGYGTQASGGSYSPNASQLLLIRVTGADAAGAGGTLVTPKPAAPATFSSVSELTLTGGSAYAVYEVVDSSATVQESAQIPVFLSVNATACPGTLSPSFAVQIAPVSTVAVPTRTDPIPRFITVMPATDCMVRNDCTASYFPTLTVDTTPIQLSANSKGSPQQARIAVGNSGTGIVTFTAAVAYPAGSASGWLSVTPTSGSNTTSLTVIADPANLNQGTYTATVNVNGGAAGSASVPVTFNVGPVGVTIQSITNAASYAAGTVSPGAFASIFGLNLNGTNVSVTFNGLPATIVYKGATQINLLVPTLLTGQLGASVIVTVDSQISNTFRVALALNAPGIFTPGIINVDDGSINGSTSPAARGSFISVYLTGLLIPLTGPVTVNIGTQTGIVPDFAGQQPSTPGLDQVNVRVPSSLSLIPNPVKLAVCIPDSLGQQVCSNQVDLYLK